MDKEIINFITKEGIEALYYCYKNEVGFPRNCGTVSSILTTVLFASDQIRTKYQVYYHRGHYKNTEYEKENWCEEYIDTTRENCDSSACIGCSCDFMNAHSWVEIISNDGRDQYIIDFTSCQFNEYIGDMEEKFNTCIFKNKYDLYEYISKYSRIIIEKGSDIWECYIPDDYVYSGEHMYNISKANFLSQKQTDITIILEAMDKCHIFA